MRTILAFALVLAACGGGGLGTTNDGGSDDLAASTGTGDLATSTHDLATSTHDLAHSDGASAPATDMSGVACGSMTCGTGDACCITPNNGSPTYACMTQCGSGTISASCDGPEDCSSGACCATIGLGGGTPTGSAACQSSSNDCSTGNVNIGTETITTKLCHSAADCTGYMGSNPLGSGQTAYDECCSYSGVSYEFCGPALINGADGITCSS